MPDRGEVWLADLDMDRVGQAIQEVLDLAE
jgi:hypothetical protein